MKKPLTSLFSALKRLSDISVPWKDLKIQLARQTEDLGHLNDDLTRVRNQRGKLRRELESVRAQWMGMTGELEKANLENNNLKTRLSSADIDLHKISSDLDQARNEREKYKQESAIARSQKESLILQLGQVKAINRILRDRFRRINFDLHKLSLETDQIRDERKSLRNELENGNIQRDSLLSQLGNAKAFNRTLRDRFRRVKADLNRLNLDIDQICSERESLRHELEKAKLQCASLTSKTEEANLLSQNRKDRLKIELDKANEYLTKTRNQREKLRRDIEFLDFLIKIRGPEEFHRTLIDARHLIVTSPAPSINSRHHTLKINWVRRDSNSWLNKNFGVDSIQVRHEPLHGLIEYIANQTNREGSFPLWSGYDERAQDSRHDLRTPNQVRIGTSLGSFFTWLARERRPNLIVEIGTAFGVSGMYWSAGLELTDRGRMLTYEPNPIWQPIAERNINFISSRFKSICGTVEDCINVSFDENETIDILFIDAIHTDAAVSLQLSLLKSRLTPGALVLIDDIDFSDDMRQCWQRLSVADDARSSIVVNGRLGVLEF